MAPSHLGQEPGSQIVDNRQSGRPRPKLRRGLLSATASQITPPAQPIFSLATPGQQFGFKLPESGQVSRGQVESSCGSLNSLMSSSRISTTFTNASHPSTAPTSCAASICPSSQGDLDVRQQPHAYSFSSHLKKLASASQSGVEAPARNSWVSSGMTNFQCNELDEPISPPPRPAGLRCTASFYSSLDGHQLRRGHMISAVPSPDDRMEAQPTEYADKGQDIDKTSPSDEERFAEAVIQGT